MEWVSLGANVILVCVTGYYAYLTKTLARSSVAAAEAAQRAAEATLLAAQVARAEATVKFDLDPRTLASGSALDSVRVLGRGAAVCVHSVTLVRQIVRLGARRSHSAPMVRLEPREDALPARLHQGEYLAMGVPASERITWDENWELWRIEAEIAYSFGDEPPMVRLAGWERPTK